MLSLIIGSDGRVRAAFVRLHLSAKRHTRLQRPVQLLYPLEVHSPVEARSPDTPHATLLTSHEIQSGEQGEDISDLRNEGDSATISSTLDQERPSQLAAQNVREIIQVLAEDDL